MKMLFYNFICLDFKSNSDSSGFLPHNPEHTCISYAVEPLSRIVHPTGHCSGGFISLVPVFSVTMEPLFISSGLIFLSQLCQVLSAWMLCQFFHDSEAHRDNPYLHFIKISDCVFLLPGTVRADPSHPQLVPS